MVDDVNELLGFRHLNVASGAVFNGWTRTNDGFSMKESPLEKGLYSLRFFWVVLL